MAGRMYTVQFQAQAETAVVDFFELTPADDKPIEIVGLFLSQHSDHGDAEDEMLPYSVIRGQTSSGSGGGTPTPVPLMASAQAAGFTAKTCNTTQASAGTPVTLHSDAFNVRAGLPLWLPEGCEWTASQANTTIVVRLMTAPADSLTMNGTVYVREMG